MLQTLERVSSKAQAKAHLHGKLKSQKMVQTLLARLSVHRAETMQAESKVGIRFRRICYCPTRCPERSRRS